MSLIDCISELEIKKILPNTKTRYEYLEELSKHISIEVQNVRNKNIIDVIIKTWDYNISKEVLRNLFRNTEKYLYNKSCKEKVTELMAEWNDLKLGNFDWPFQPKLFDQYVHRLNRENLKEREKDEVVALNAIKFRRIKDINARRNDYIEYLIFEHGKNIIPTFGNSRGVDFYINGIPFDQKVGRNVGGNFIKLYGSKYREIAIQHPDLVAKNLYEQQDEERFGYEPRLLIVYLDDDLTTVDIETSLENISFDHPIEIKFEYHHSDGRNIKYKTYCYLILLHK